MVQRSTIFSAFLAFYQTSLPHVLNASNQLCANMTHMQTVPPFTIQP
jgi:hypothetical protein